MSFGGFTPQKAQALSLLAASLSNNPRALPQTISLNQALMGMKDEEAQQRQQQVSDASVRSMINTAPDPGDPRAAGMPATRSFEVNGRTIGRDAAAIPLVSQASTMRNLQRGAGPAFNAAYLQSMINQAFAPPAAPIALGARDRLVTSEGKEIVGALPDTESKGPGTRGWFSDASGKTFMAYEASPETQQKVASGQWRLADEPKEARGLGAIFRNMFGSDIPAGMRPVVDASGNIDPLGRLEPIPGGSQDPKIIEEKRRQELMALAPKEKIAVDVATKFYDNAIKQIDKILANPNTVDVIGGWEGSFEPMGIISPKNREALSDIEALDDMLQVKGLEIMRAASPTGGAVGSVTEREWPKLSARFGNLRRTQSEEDYKKNLKAIKEDLKTAKMSTKFAYQSTYGGINGGMQPQTNDIETLVNKYAPR